MLAGSLRAATAALAVARIAAPAATASTIHGPAMSAAAVRAMQARGVREVIVERKAGVTAAEQATLRAQAGVSYVGPGPLPNTEIDRAPAGWLASAVASLTRNSQVRYAEPNGEVHAASGPNDTYFSQQWGLSNTGQSVKGTGGSPGDDLGASFAWPHSTGTGVTVGVVDTGVDSSAPDLQGQLVAGYDFIGDDTSTQDQNGHGTHVSGIIAAAQNNAIGVSGVAPGARVMPLQVLDASGSGTFTDVANAFNYAGQNHIPIVNASLGGTSVSQTLEQAIAGNPNTLYVVAAGNNGANNDDPSTPFYPCDLPEANLICVGASDQSDQPAWFSDFGAANVDLFAPGVNILSTWLGGQYAYEVTATNPAGPTLAISAGTPPVGLPGPAPAPSPPAGTGGSTGSTGGKVPAPTSGSKFAGPVRRSGVGLTHVAVRGGRGGRALVFTLSAQARVRITLSGSGRARSAAGDVVRLSVSAHRGANRYALTALLRGRRLRRGRYAVTVRAGNRAVTVALNVA